MVIRCAGHSLGQTFAKLALKELPPRLLAAGPTPAARAAGRVSPLQALVEAAPSGSTIFVPAGTLASLERLNMQLRLNGENQIRGLDRRERLEQQRVGGRERA